MKDLNHQECPIARKKRNTEKKGLRRLASRFETDFREINLDKRRFEDEEGLWIDLEYAAGLMIMAARTLYDRRAQYGLKCKTHNSKKYMLFEEVAAYIMHKRVWQAPIEASPAGHAPNRSQEDVRQVESQNPYSHGINEN